MIAIKLRENSLFVANVWFEYQFINARNEFINWIATGSQIGSIVEVDKQRNRISYSLIYRPTKLQYTQVV